MIVNTCPPETPSAQKLLSIIFYCTHEHNSNVHAMGAIEGTESARARRNKRSQLASVGNEVEPMKKGSNGELTHHAPVVVLNKLIQ